MISFDDVSFSYPGEMPIFSGITFRFKEGISTALMGPSGCGKTTLLKLACGLLMPSSGRILIGAEEKVVPGSVRGVLFHEDTLLPWLNIIDNVLFAIEEVQNKRDEAINLLDQFGLSNYIKSYPFELSSGMRKRVEFARALISDPNLLFLDEPFSSIDPATREQLWNLWLKVPAVEKRTRILTTHDAEEAYRIADEILFLGGGWPVRIHSNLNLQDAKDEPYKIINEIKHKINNPPIIQ